MHSTIPLLTTLPFLIHTISCQSQSPFINSHAPGSAIRSTLKSASIITDVLDDFIPSWYLDIAYPERHEVVSLGNDIPVAHVQSRPTFVVHPIDGTSSLSHNKTFTIALTDPDAKSRANPKWSEMCHWLLTNVTFADPGPPHASDLEIQKQAGELKGYKPPGPPPKTGPHRYVFVLLAGDEDGKAAEAPRKRKHWGYRKVRHGVRDWAAEMGLQVVGANFFYAADEKQ